MRYLSTVLFLFAINYIYCQNLVENGSIEKLVNDTCPPSRNMSSYTGAPTGATSITGFKDTPDILNECSGVKWNVPLNDQIDIPKNYLGYQWARTGKGMIAYWNSIYPSMYNNNLGDEIITFKLTDSLTLHKKYCLRLFTVLSDSVGQSTDLIEAVLSSQFSMSIPDQIPYYSIISNSGKGYIYDTLNWIQIMDTIVATSNELYIHIGRFHKLSQNNIGAVNSSASLLTYPAYNVLLYYIDDVALWPCDTIAPNANAGADTIICLGDSAQLGTHNYSDYYYSWWHDSICYQNGPTEIQRDKHKGKIWVKPTKNTWYYLQATDFKYDKTRDSVYVVVKNCTPTMSDTTICIGEEVIIGNGDTYFASWLWSPIDYLDNPWIATPIARPATNITYYVTSTDTLGRAYTDSISITVEACDLPPEIIIPNVITPNGDGINDVFKYQNEEFWKIETQIFNRWGQLVFLGSGAKRWDATFQGEKISDGVYFYYITAQAIGFKEVIVYRGTLTVIK